MCGRDTFPFFTFSAVLCEALCVAVLSSEKLIGFDLSEEGPGCENIAVVSGFTEI